MHDSIAYICTVQLKQTNLKLTDMEIQNNNQSIKFELSNDCIDVYIDDKHAGDFTVSNDGGYIEIQPSNIALDCISEERKGHYSTIIDTVLNGELSDEICEFFGDVFGIEFKSVLRTEKACKFWSKRGFDNEYNKEDHERGQQEEIEITIL